MKSTTQVHAARYGALPLLLACAVLLHSCTTVELLPPASAGASEEYERFNRFAAEREATIEFRSGMMARAFRVTATSDTLRWEDDRALPDSAPYQNIHRVSFTSSTSTAIAGGFLGVLGGFLLAVVILTVLTDPAPSPPRATGQPGGGGDSGEVVTTILTLIGCAVGGVVLGAIIGARIGDKMVFEFQRNGEGSSATP
jgi:hypothetical protein